MRKTTNAKLFKKINNLAKECSESSERELSESEVDNLEQDDDSFDITYRCDECKELAGDFQDTQQKNN